VVIVGVTLIGNSAGGMSMYLLLEIITFSGCLLSNFNKSLRYVNVGNAQFSDRDCQCVFALKHFFRCLSGSKSGCRFQNPCFIATLLII
jgi:hypothetical protein